MSKSIAQRTTRSMIFIIIMIIISIIIFLSFQDIRPPQKQITISIDHEAIEQ